MRPYAFYLIRPLESARFFLISSEFTQTPQWILFLSLDGDQITHCWGQRRKRTHNNALFQTTWTYGKVGQLNGEGGKITQNALSVDLRLVGCFINGHFRRAKLTLPLKIAWATSAFLLTLLRCVSKRMSATWLASTMWHLKDCGMCHILIVFSQFSRIFRIHNFFIWTPLPTNKI